MYSEAVMLEAIEHGFKIIREWNNSHSEEERIRRFAALLDFLKLDGARGPLEKLIAKYGIEFYNQPLGKDSAPFNEWKLIYNGREYKTPYKDEETLNKYLEKQNKKEPRFEMVERMKGGVFDEVDNIIKEV